MYELAQDQAIVLTLNEIEQVCGGMVKIGCEGEDVVF